MEKKYGEKKKAILMALSEKRRFTELMKLSGASDTLVIKVLREFNQKGWVKKLPDGRYVLTESGRRVLAKMLLAEKIYVLYDKGYGDLIEEKLGEVEFIFSLVYLLYVGSRLNTILLSLLNINIENEEDVGRIVSLEEKDIRGKLKMLLEKLDPKWKKRFDSKIVEEIENDGIYMIGYYGERKDFLNFLKKCLEEANGFLRLINLKMLSLSKKPYVRKYIEMVDEKKKKIEEILEI